MNRLRTIALLLMACSFGQVSANTLQTILTTGLVMSSLYQANGANYHKTLGGSKDDRFLAVTRSTDDYIFAGGGTRSQGNGAEDALLVKYNEAGTLQWQKRLGDSGVDAFFDVVPAASGAAIGVGRTRRLSVDPGQKNVLVSKITSAGAFSWGVAFGGSSQDIGEGAAIDSNGNTYVVGRTSSFGSGWAVFVAKVDSSGAYQWFYTLDGSANDFAYRAEVDSNDDLVVVGLTHSGDPTSATLIFKVDTTTTPASPTIAWSKTFGLFSPGESYSDAGFDIALDSSDNIYIVGDTLEHGAGQDASVIELDSSGDFVDGRAFGQGSSVERGYGIVRDSSGNLYVGGYTDKLASGKLEFMIAKLQSDLTMDWYRVDGGGTSIQEDDELRDIVLTSTGEVVVVGLMDSLGQGGLDASIARYEADGTGSCHTSETPSDRAIDWITDTEDITMTWTSRTVTSGTFSAGTYFATATLTEATQC